MSTILTVRFSEGDIAQQLFLLKVSALSNNDKPSLWRLTEGIIEMLLVSARDPDGTRWPTGYVSESRLFGVPVDYVHQMPHLLCEDYIVYPYVVAPPPIVRAH
jgi:hypothetical protein